MPTPTQTELKAQMERLLKQLDKQTKTSKKNRGYYTGDDCAIPEAVVKAKLRKAYRLLMPMSEAPWGSLIVDSVQDRLEVTGIRSGDDGVDAAIWSQGWQANQMDAESPLAHNAALVDGRVYATVWPGDDDQPEIVLDDATQMAVEYREGRHKVRHRVAALRRWKDDDETEHVTLYRPEGIYKFTEAKEQGRAAGRIKAGEKWWEKREIDGEPWPVPNPWGVLNVVEIAINRRLAPGRFLDARGEFANCLGLIDRINLLTFLGLVVAFWMGFPLRGVIGDKVKTRVLEDDEGNPLIDEATGKPKVEVKPPFDQVPGGVVLIENKDAKTFEFTAADRKNLAVIPELDQLATITKTPRYYFPIDGGLSNVSADMIRATEGPLHAKVRGLHKPFLGEGWEEVMRLCGLMLDTEVILPTTAEIQWADHESRSLAERADVATKLASLELPWQAIADKYLGWTQEEIARVEGLMAAAPFRALLEAVGGGGGQADDELAPAA